VDLVVGCSFADLLPPARLARSLLRIGQGGALLYLPITFAGSTEFDPPDWQTSNSGNSVDSGKSDGRKGFAGLSPALEPAHPGSGGGGGGGGLGRLPTDALVETAYHCHLEQGEGQHLDLEALVAAASASGFSLLARGASDWVMTPAHDPSCRPMCGAMLNFLARAVPPALLKQGFSPAEWLMLKRVGLGAKGGDAAQDRAGGDCLSLVVGNEDLLFSIPSARAWQVADYEAAVLTAPRTVAVKVRRRKGGGPPAGMVEVKSAWSMISNGTELKFYRGEFDKKDGPLDATIEGLSDAGMGYPMEYGYSLAGVVTSVGAGVDAAGWVGSRVFCFAPHASAHCLDPEGGALRKIPRGIDLQDAVFLPAVETALSIAHDAHPRACERVAVFGQGLIGLLVTCILAPSCRLSAVDPQRERRDRAKGLGACEALTPEEAAASATHGRFDVVIEVSGSASALGSALACTTPGGRLVLASWYKGDVTLDLGTAFHRSHVHIVASQVSELPAAVRGTWTKERRFEAAWDLIRELRPSKALGPWLRVPGLGGLKKAYDALDKRGAVTALVEYHAKDPKARSRL